MDIIRGEVMPENNSSKKNPSESFADMMREFGNALSEIFNDPVLKEKARDFGDSATASAKAFAGRFKDEEVKGKFKDLGNTAKNFGESIADYFREDKTEKNSKKNEDKDPEEIQKKNNI